MKIFISILACAIALFGGNIIKVSQKQQVDLGIKTQEVTKMETISLSPYNGVVVLDKKDVISISSNLESVVENIFVRKFDSIKKGQKLLTLRSNALLNLQKEYIEALITSQNIDKDYERDLRLQSDGIISSKKLLISQKDKQNSDLRVKLGANQLLSSGFDTSMLAKIQTTHLPIAEIHIFAPRDGVIHKIEANIGEVISTGRSIIEMNADGKRFIELSVPVNIIEDISLGDICSFSTYTAKITAIGNVVNSSSQSVQVRALIDNGTDIMINRIYQVVISKNISGAFKIKKSALVFNENNAYIFKKVAEGFEVQGVKIISEGPVCYIIKADLKETDEVAVSSTSALLSAMESENE
ncbi:efflux RND transporter periplasmic adaptor subunit [bacterium]|nr:efflux RND transporter periplasmic adaptor subunit [bacterium]MBU1993315.1 efflux RND transporter periplasmic adaptor subunit [bacterium]